MKKYIKAIAVDSELLTSLAIRAKAHWGYPETWMEEWREELSISSEYINSNIIIMLKLDENIVGFYGLELKGDFAYLCHLWVEPEHIGTGLGKLLFRQACKEATNRGCSLMELISDPNTEGFYQHNGATKIDEVHTRILGTPRVLPRMRVNLKNTSLLDLNDEESNIAQNQTTKIES